MQQDLQLTGRLIKEAGQLFRFGLPMAIGQVAMVGVGLTNVYVTGQASPEDLAGVTLGGSITLFVSLILGGILFANAPMVGHHYGAGNHQAVRGQFQQCLWLAIPLGIITMLAMASAIQLIGMLDAEPEVIAVARGYLVPITFALFIQYLYISARTTLEAIGAPRVAMVLNTTGLLLHIPLAFGLVQGKFGLPQLGGIGCGWAVLAAVTCQSIAAYLYLARGRAARCYSFLANFARPQLTTIKEMLQLGIPIAGSILFEFGYFGVIPLMVAHLGADVVSGHSIAFQFDALMFIIPFAIAQSITITVSHRLGRNEHSQARETCWAGIGLIAAIALVQVAVYILFRHHIAALFTAGQNVIDIAAQLMIFAAGYRLMDALSVGAQGALRAYRVTRPPMYIQFVAFWVVGFPLAYSLALTNWWGPAMGVGGFWMSLVVTLSLSALALILMVWKVQASHTEITANADYTHR